MVTAKPEAKARTVKAGTKPDAKAGNKAAPRAKTKPVQPPVEALRATVAATAQASAAAPVAAAAPASVMGAPTQAFGAAIADMAKSLGGLQLPVPELAQLQADYLQQAGAVWNQSLQRLQGLQSDSADTKPSPLGDRRFGNAEWLANPAAAFTAQMYLLNARTLLQMADKVDADAKTKARIRFAVQQWVDASSPSNFLALNPEALKKAVETKGESLTAGMQQLLADVHKGHVSQTDESVFEVGRNVATTAGSVVFENALFQLIEYKPLTAKVHERPMLFVPPCINKYYILDLQPENSLIRYTVEQGHRTFVVSWRNPDASLLNTTWDDYIEDGAIQAIHTVQQIASTESINRDLSLGTFIG